MDRWDGYTNVWSDELYHYGRKGMKWGQDIFSKDDNLYKRAGVGSNKRKYGSAVIDGLMGQGNLVSGIKQLDKENKDRLSYMDQQSQQYTGNRGDVAARLGETDPNYQEVLNKYSGKADQYKKNQAYNNAMERGRYKLQMYEGLKNWKPETNQQRWQRNFNKTINNYKNAIGGAVNKVRGFNKDRWQNSFNKTMNNYRSGANSIANKVKNSANIWQKSFDKTMDKYKNGAYNIYDNVRRRIDGDYDAKRTTDYIRGIGRAQAGQEALRRSAAEENRRQQENSNRLKRYRRTRYM